MLLVLTNSTDATADYLIPALSRSGVRSVRLDTDTLVSRIEFSYVLGLPAIHIDGRWHEPDQFRHVWYRRPERLRDGTSDDLPEGRYVLDEWSEALEGFFAHIAVKRWMNHPSGNAAASRKLEQLTVARSIGLQVPATLVTQNASKLRQFYDEHSGKLIVKPMSGGYVARPDNQQDSLIYTNRVLDEHLIELGDLPACPTLFQEYVEKRYDVRITVVDQDVHAVQLLADEGGVQRCDIRRNNMSDVLHRMISLPQGIEHRLRNLVDHYGLRFAAIDMVVDRDDNWYFLEVNPNGQWAWLDLVGATDITSSFVKSFSS